MHTSRFLGSILLVAGISIGAAMLALPAVTAAYGFFPSVGLLLVCWACMAMTGLLMLEVNLWFKPGTNIVSMSEGTLGLPGKVVAWLTYALLFYSVMAAYVSAMGSLIQGMLRDLFGWEIYNGSGALVLVLLVGLAIYHGARSVDYLNRGFFFAKVATYICVVVLVTPHVNLPNLTTANFNYAWLALPVVITGFGFQNIVPSLRIYLNDDVRKLRLSILIGSLITLGIYILWEFMILGVIPIEGERGLLSILVTGQPASGIAESLHVTLNNNWIGWLFRAFTVFAVVTSFIGVSFSLFDFVIDSFNIRRTAIGKIYGLLLIFVPSLLFAFFYPDGFVLALTYAGIFVAILLGILPVAMTWSGRYHKKIAHGYQSKIGRLPMVLVVVFCIVLIISQWVIV
jgi:tyrosine-specific transport protein